MAIADEQYDVVASRRVATDGLLWQTPVLSLTAQAFLFAIALGPGSSLGARLVAAILAFVASIGSIQLMAKHRFHEVRDAELLEEYEKLRTGFQVIHGTAAENPGAAWYLKISSYRLWLCMLGVFALAAAVVFAGVLRGWHWLVDTGC
jgi:hypothetical protein